MGGYEVQDDTVDLLVTAAYRLFTRDLASYEAGNEQIRTEASKLGRELILANRLSFNLGEEPTEPIEYQWTPVDEIHVAPLGGQHYVTILVAAHQFEHESRDHDSWLFSRAWAITDALKYWAEDWLYKIDWPKVTSQRPGGHAWLGQDTVNFGFGWTRADGFPDLQPDQERLDDAALQALADEAKLKANDSRMAAMRCLAALFARDVLARQPEAVVGYLETKDDVRGYAQLMGVSVHGEDGRAIEHVDREGQVFSPDGKLALPADRRRAELLHALQIAFYQPRWTHAEQLEGRKYEGPSDRTRVTSFRQAAEWSPASEAGKQTRFEYED
ncbi:hypothetical protein [Sinomonas albida]|uniref:hypothetical protein n=1 Tax=Sinomonas albida TaxID=369942 RepID=UPI0010A89FC6|nr:hypothetical protein [Sinomonas albida]